MSSQDSSTSLYVSADIIGGLGNQMFIIATAVAYALKTNRKVLYDSSQTIASSCSNRKTYWNTDIMKTIQSSSIFVDSSNNAFQHNKQATVTYSEPYYHYNEIPDFKDCNVHLNGYFQSCKYFENAKELLASFFTLKSENRPQFVSVHIRRGDYLHLSNYHTVQSFDYYNEAIQRHFSDCRNFLFFSDDAEWVKANLGRFNVPNDSNIQVFESSCELESLAAMTACKAGHIIANSSFSWWAAYLHWLESNETRVVVAPSNWFGPDGPKDTADVYVDGWHIV